MEAGRGEEGRRHHSLQLFLKYTGGDDIDTSKISFVFCGAFSARAADIAEKEGGTRIGFGAPGGGSPSGQDRG